MTPTEAAQPQVVLAREVIEIKMRMDDAQDQRLCVHLKEILSIYESRKAERERLNRKTSFQFNPLRRIPIHEPTHSRVLADLLDPHGSNGQGDLFLQDFLRQQKTQKNFSPPSSTGLVLTSWQTSVRPSTSAFSSLQRD